MKVLFLVNLIFAWLVLFFSPHTVIIPCQSRELSFLQGHLHPGFLQRTTIPVVNHLISFPHQSIMKTKEEKQRCLLFCLSNCFFSDVNLPCMSFFSHFPELFTSICSGSTSRQHHPVAPKVLTPPLDYFAPRFTSVCHISACMKIRYSWTSYTWLVSHLWSKHYCLFEVFPILPHHPTRMAALAHQHFTMEFLHQQSKITSCKSFQWN